MTQQTDIKYFDEQQIRTVWDEDEGRLYFSIVDVVQVLTEQPTVRGASTYWAVLKKRIKDSKGDELLTNCKQLKLLAADGKSYKSDVADTEQLLEIVPLIPSQKVENFKQWLEPFYRDTNIDKGEIIMYQPDATIKLEVRLDNETVWLTQQQMAELFDKDRSVIGRHIRNIYDEQELEQDSTCAKFAHKVSPGGQLYEYTAYNLDVIISVGYRVKSVRGTKFRQWASKILKSYLLKGYAADSRYFALEQKVSEQGKQIADLKNKVDFFVRTSLPPVEGIFYDGQIFDAYVQITSIIKQAKKSIVIIDNYIDETVLTMLSKKSAGVDATIYTKQYSAGLQLAVTRFNAQYPPITVNVCQYVHDRFLIIDDTVYLFGASLKDAGKKLFAFIKMQETPAAEILKLIH